MTKKNVIESFSYEGKMAKSYTPNKLKKKIEQLENPDSIESITRKVVDLIKNDEVLKAELSREINKTSNIINSRKTTKQKKVNLEVDYKVKDLQEFISSDNLENSESLIMRNGFKILLVDDEADILELQREELGYMGFKNIDCATSGEEALEKLLSDKFEIIVSDYRMDSSYIDGFKLFYELKKRQISSMFLLLTAYESESEVQKLKDAGIRIVQKDTGSISKVCDLIKAFYAVQIQQKLSGLWR